MSDDKLAVIENVNGTALESYQSRDEVRELADRLLSLHPAAGEVGKPGMIAVAQLALLVGASPLPGTNEIHVWKSGQKIQFQLGINYYRRKADEQGGVLWSLQPRQMRDDEREENGVANGMLAAICKAVRRDDMENYAAKGYKANQIFEMCGRTGIGTAGTNEGKAGRTAIWTAFKRAEVDLYRALFPTMMAKVSQAQEGMVKIGDGPKWKEFEGEEIDDMFSYGDAPERVEVVDFETGEIEDIDYEEIPEDDFNQDAEPTGPEETAVYDGEPVHHDPEFWLEQATEAKDLDGLAQALYKLHEPSGVFADATATKKAIVHICGSDAGNGNAIQAIGKYVTTVADGVAKKKAVTSAKMLYKTLLENDALSEQDPLFPDEMGADTAVSGAFE